MQLLLTQIKTKVQPPVFTQTKHLVLLHGLFGTLSNWQSVTAEFTATHQVHAPVLPLFDGNLLGKNLDRLVEFVHKYFHDNEIEKAVLVGNSLGGHIALLYALKYPQKVEKLVLTGSSGLYENTMGSSFPRVRDYDYIENKVREVFYQKEVADAEMVAYVYGVAKDKRKVLSIIGLAREAQKQNLKNLLPSIKIKTLLIWGLQDVVTPPEVGEEFKQLLPHAELHFLDRCGHAPMMERPERFNYFLNQFLNRN